MRVPFTRAGSWQQPPAALVIRRVPRGNGMTVTKQLWAVQKRDTFAQPLHTYDVIHPTNFLIFRTEFVIKKVRAQQGGIP